MRKNCEWDIIAAIQMDPGVEVVIGDRHTDFEPYVCWYCYDGAHYRDGYYCQTYREAAEEVGRRLFPIHKAHQMVEDQRYEEDCQNYIPYMRNDEGYGKAVALYRENIYFRRRVHEAYGRQWRNCVDYEMHDTKADLICNALSEAMREYKEEK